MVDGMSALFPTLYGCSTSESCLSRQIKKRVRVDPGGGEADLIWEDPLEKGMATHSSILAWKIPWTEEAGKLQSMELQRVGRDRATNTFTFHSKKIVKSYSASTL